jgi:gas vesicle protein
LCFFVPSWWILSAYAKRGPKVVLLHPIPLRDRIAFREDQMKHREKFGTWFMVGIGIGTLMGLVCAPLASKKGRKQFAKTAGQAGEAIAKTTVQAGEAIAKTAVQAGEAIADGSRVVYEKGCEIAQDTGNLAKTTGKLAKKMVA